MSSSRNSRSAGVATALIALPIVYVLSIGPVAYWVEGRGWFRSPAADAALSLIYAPLMLIVDSTGLTEPFDRYLEWWVELSKTP